MTCLPALALGATLAAQGSDPTELQLQHRKSLPTRRAAPANGDAQVQQRILAAGPSARDRVAFDQPGDGRIWALGNTYKASFGADGFVYTPFLGSDAKKNYPVQFVLRSARVGGKDVQLAANAQVTRADARVTFERGPVREVYDLTPDGVEQTFVVDGETAGDVDVELDVTTELQEVAANAGLRFGNELGGIEYGAAFLVSGTSKSEISTTLSGRTVRLHVPAAQRGAGPVVIDPLIRSVQLAPTLMSSEIPDVAYDATTDRWAVVWVHVFSQTDHDVVSELRASNGDAIAGSFQPIEATTASFSWPRIANLNSANRFLVGMEKYVASNPAGQRYTIWGRTLDAAAPFTVGTLTQISPASTSDQLSVDVGGDSGTGTRWTVVWVHGGDIHARQVEANGVPLANTIPIENTSSPCINPQISLSNGAGLITNPCWCIVYMLQASATNWDVYGSLMEPTGVLRGTHLPINVASTNDMYTYVSSPRLDLGGHPAFLVSYERQLSPPEMIAKVIDGGFNTVVSEVNLTRRYGFSGIYTRVESDGIRYAATCQVGQIIRAGTLAMVNNDLVLHESLQDLNYGDSPALASKRSGGGLPTDYGVVFDSTSPPARAVLALYQGRAPAGGFKSRPMSCGLTITASGRPFVGEAANFTLTNPGADLAALFLGVPAPALAVCPACSLGLDLAGPVLRFPTPMSLPLPADATFVGVTLSVQGLAAGSGTCLGSLRLSDTIDFTIQ